MTESLRDMIVRVLCESGVVRPESETVMCWHRDPDTGRITSRSASPEEVANQITVAVCEKILHDMDAMGAEDGC